MQDQCSMVINAQSEYVKDCDVKLKISFIFNKYRCIAELHHKMAEHFEII